MRRKKNYLEREARRTLFYQSKTMEQDTLVRVIKEEARSLGIFLEVQEEVVIVYKSVVARVDILIPKLCLGIEADSPSHNKPAIMRLDEYKEKAFLSGLGLVIDRFENDEIVNPMKRLALRKRIRGLLAICRSTQERSNLRSKLHYHRKNLLKNDAGIERYMSGPGVFSQIKPAKIRQQKNRAPDQSDCLSH